MDVPRLRGGHAGDHLFQRPQIERGQRLLRRRPPDHGLAERPRGRRRLHERRELPRHCRHDRDERLRRLHVFGWLPRRLSDRPLHRRRAAPELWKIYDGRHAGLSLEPKTCSRSGFLEHAHRLGFLHDRPNGRSGRAGAPVDSWCQLRSCCGGGRGVDGGVCRFRRNARHHLGANHQGHPAHERQYIFECPRSPGIPL